MPLPLAFANLWKEIRSEVELEITFGTRRLERIFSSDRELRREYGPVMAETIKNRVAVLRRVNSLAEVPAEPPTRRHLLSGPRSGQYAIDLVHPYRLILEPNHNPVPRRADRGIDTDQVTAIVIVAVVDYH